MHSGPAHQGPAYPADPITPEPGKGGGGRLELSMPELVSINLTRKRKQNHNFVLLENFSRNSSCQEQRWKTEVEAVP